MWKHYQLTQDTFTMNIEIAEPRTQAQQGSRYRDPVQGEEGILLARPPQAQCTLQYMHNIPEKENREVSVLPTSDILSNSHTSIGKTTHKAER